MKETKNILVVDDNQINLQVVANYLKECNYNIAVSLDGKNALKILESGEIDLILMDIMMPEMDGIETTKIIKQNEKYQDIPIIFLTAKTQPKDIVNGFQAGGVDYITKPFNGEELKMRVKNHLDLAEAKNTILEFQKTRDRLYSILAHDIRSPLTSISMLLDGIAEKYIDTSGPNFDRLIREISINTKDTLILIQNILEWTKTQSKAIIVTPENINIHGLVEREVNNLSLNIEEKHIMFSKLLPEHLFVYADEITVSNIFRNIISNAIKFTPNYGKIEVTYKETLSYVDIIFKDNGVGMSPYIIEKIFTKDEHFTSKGTNNEKGTGLGLYMVKDFVKINNGKIKVESELDNGTTFTISLPKSMPL